ncbi:MAG: flavodoxin reductase, partial [Pseudomonadota bacterium]
QYIFTKPEGFTFTPGQATDLAIDRDGWRDEARPFTFTSDPEAKILSFVIKSYFDHDGVTKALWSLSAGDHVKIGDPWGAIEPKGAGIFIAGGAGITPFIPVIDDLAERGQLTGSTLIFANKDHHNIILREHFAARDGLDCVFVTDDGVNADHAGRLDGDVLGQEIADFDERFYLCGPPAMQEAVLGYLHAKGVTNDQVVMED